MPEEQRNNPLLCNTLEALLLFLVDRYGWEALGEILPLHCFRFDPVLNQV